jgi:hypothetical protein
MKHTTTRVLAAIGAALVLMIGGAVAYAAFPTTDGVVSTCVLKPGGTIRVIDPATQSCKKGEVPLNWNQEGRDLSDFTVYEADRTSTTNNIVAGDRVYTNTALCDAGDRLLWGNTHIAQDPAFPNQEMNFGEPNALADDGWTVLIRVHPDAQVPNAIFAQVTAQCADTAAPFDRTN